MGLLLQIKNNYVMLMP